MHHSEIIIEDKSTVINADVKIPKKDNRIGLILLHGGIMNRKSLSREENCFAEYCSNELNAHVITPDFYGETRVNNQSFSSITDSSEIISANINYLINNFGVEKIYCFGHSMGSTFLINSLDEIRDIDAIVTYGGPTSAEYNGFLLNYVYKFLKNMRKIMGSTFNMENYTWIFDKETRNYYYNVMKVKEEYKTDMDKFEYEVDFLFDVMDIIPIFEKKILEWKNPALVLFGTEDSITRHSMKKYSDGFVNEHFVAGHILDGHHITPCREEPSELYKFKPMMDFLNNQ